MMEGLKLFVDDPKSSRRAMLFYMFICLAIVMSSVLMVLETLPEYYGRRRTMMSHWFVVESAVVSVLTLEFLLRLYANVMSSFNDVIKWILSWAFLTECLSVMPFWVDIIVGGKRYAEIQRLTVLRLFRLLRLINLLSGSDHLRRTLEALRRAVERCSDVLATLFLMQFLTATCFATLLYFAERGEWRVEEGWMINGQPSKFNSIPACYWYVYTVLSTVGLGDMTPQTALGKSLTLPLMLLTVLLLTFPSVIVANHFTISCNDEHGPEESRHLL